jgi:hypothetical protein
MAEQEKPMNNAQEFLDLLKHSMEVSPESCMKSSSGCSCPPLDHPSQIRAITGSMLMFEFVTRIAERLVAKG